MFNDAFIADISSRLFAVQSASEAEEFLRTLDTGCPFSRSLGYYLRHWLNTREAPGGEAFRPGDFLAEDLSAVMYGRVPAIFMGTNYWGAKPYCGEDALAPRVDAHIKALERLREKLPGRKFALIVVPDKDCAFDKIFDGGGRFATVDAALDRMARHCAATGVVFHYDTPLSGLAAYMSPRDFEFPDSHLPSRIYIHLFAETLQGLGLDWPRLHSLLTLATAPVYGDLSCKFETKSPQPQPFSLPEVRSADIRLMAGDETFRQPLGDTRQFLRNESALHPGKVLVLGDSHSSILSQKRLTYLFASYFAECEFFWNPMGVRSGEIESDAEYVILEISQRFVF